METDEIGSKLVVFTVPALNEVDVRVMEKSIAEAIAPSGLCLESASAFGRLGSLLADLDIEIIDLLPDFRSVAREDGINLFRRSDLHWNPEGHTLAAEIVVSALFDRGFLPTSN